MELACARAREQLYARIRISTQLIPLLLLAMHDIMCIRVWMCIRDWAAIIDLHGISLVVIVFFVGVLLPMLNGLHDHSPRGGGAHTMTLLGGPLVCWIRRRQLQQRGLPPSEVVTLMVLQLPVAHASDLIIV